MARDPAGPLQHAQRQRGVHLQAAGGLAGGQAGRGGRDLDAVQLVHQRGHVDALDADQLHGCDLARAREHAGGGSARRPAPEAGWAACCRGPVCGSRFAKGRVCSAQLRRSKGGRSWKHATS
jgi:hypothetical protein